MEPHQCARCGVGFEPRRQNLPARFCSTTCRESARAAKIKAARAAARAADPKTCPECGVQFVGKRVDTRFCSMRCFHRQHVRNLPVRACTHPGCKRRGRTDLSSGLCDVHRRRFAAGTDMDAPTRKIRNPVGQWSADGNGYHRRIIGGKVVLQHRQVVEEDLGRPLEKWEHVHHKNGVRTDNRRANLEVWISGHPSGQRPEDIAAFLVEHYREIVVAALE